MATTTTASEAIKQVVHDPVTRGVFTYDTEDPASFYKLFGEPVPSDGGTQYEWTLQTSAFGGVSRAEGDQHSALQNIAFERPAISYASIMYDTTIGVTEHLKAALRGSQAAWFPVVSRQVSEAMRGIVDAVHTRWIGATLDGIRLAVAATGTYAGQDHAAVTGWNSASTTVSAALSLGVMDDMRETLNDNERRAKGHVVLSPEDRITDYTRLVGPGVRAQQMSVVQNGSQPRTDLGESRDPVYAGAALIGLPDLLDTTMLFVRKSDFKIVAHESEVGNGGWHVSPSSPNQGHYENQNLCLMHLLVCEDPFRQGALITITDT